MILWVPVTPTAVTAPPAAPTGAPHKNWTLLAVCLGIFMLLVDLTIVVVAIPDIRSSLHTSFSDVQWTIDAYSLSLAALLLPTGSLADILGRRRVFAFGIGIFTLGSLLCGLADSGTELIVWRALQGVGGATVFATSLALLAQTFHGRERGFALGVWGAVAGLSTALGPLIGGVLTTAINEADGTASLELALTVAGYFDVDRGKARQIAKEVGQAVKGWRSAAAKAGIKAAEIDRVASAFEHDDLERALKG